MWESAVFLPPGRQQVEQAWLHLPPDLVGGPAHQGANAVVLLKKIGNFCTFSRNSNMVFLVTWPFLAKMQGCFFQRNFFLPPREVYTHGDRSNWDTKKFPWKLHRRRADILGLIFTLFFARSSFLFVRDREGGKIGMIPGAAAAAGWIPVSRKVHQKPLPKSTKHSPIPWNNTIIFLKKGHILREIAIFCPMPNWRISDWSCLSVKFFPSLLSLVIRNLFCRRRRSLDLLSSTRNKERCEAHEIFREVSQGTAVKKKYLPPRRRSATALLVTLTPARIQCP